MRGWLMSRVRRNPGRCGVALDDAEYLELMVSAVQHLSCGDIEYEILLPGEVIAYREGVCTEKSVLFAALTARDVEYVPMRGLEG